MTTLLIILSFITLVLLGLFIISTREDNKLIKKYEDLISNQEIFMNTLVKDYDQLADKFANLVLTNKEQMLRNVIEDFLENCSEEMEIEHFKDKFREAIK